MGDANFGEQRVGNRKPLDLLLAELVGTGKRSAYHFSLGQRGGAPGLVVYV